MRKPYSSIELALVRCILLLFAPALVGAGEICRTRLLTHPTNQKAILFFFAQYASQWALVLAMVSVTVATLGSVAWLARHVASNTMEGDAIKGAQRSLSNAARHLAMLGTALVGTIWLDATYRPVAPLTTIAAELAAVGLVRLTGNGAVSLVGEVSTHDTTSQIESVHTQVETRSNKWWTMVHGPPVPGRVAMQPLNFPVLCLTCQTFTLGTKWIFKLASALFGTKAVWANCRTSLVSLAS